MKYALIIFALIVILFACSMDGENRCETGTTNPGSAQGQRDMKDCAKGWD